MDSAMHSSPPQPTELSIGQCALLACIWEATAPKPGNVHRAADFEDLCYPDFLNAAAVTAPVFQAASSQPLGQAILAAVAATRAAVNTNVNLGAILLIAPLASVPRGQTLSCGIPQVLAGLSAADAQNVYAAIRLARPGGLGQVETHDVNAAPPADLLIAMRAAAERDLVARQYTNDFAQVLDEVVPAIGAGCAAGWPLWQTIVQAHLQLMNRHPDSLIARKCGPEVAAAAAAHAGVVLAAGPPESEAYQDALADLDFWLRSDGHQRNPGTTADLIAAGLFAALRDGIIKMPFRWN
jgi:triphosphoribosyl-dephospho-CoA synthase